MITTPCHSMTTGVSDGFVGGSQEPVIDLKWKCHGAVVHRGCANLVTKQALQIQLCTPSQISTPLRSVGGSEADQAESSLALDSGGDAGSGTGGVRQAGSNPFNKYTDSTCPRKSTSSSSTGAWWRDKRECIQGHSTLKADCYWASFGRAKSIVRCSVNFVTRFVLRRLGRDQFPTDNSHEALHNHSRRTNCFRAIRTDEMVECTVGQMTAQTVESHLRLVQISRCYSSSHRHHRSSLLQSTSSSQIAAGRYQQRKRRGEGGRRNALDSAGRAANSVRMGVNPILALIWSLDM